MYYLKIQKCTIYTFHPLPHFPVQIFRNQPFVSSLDSFSHSSSPFSLFRNSPRSRREWFWRKVEYLEIEVYRTTPLVPDDGLVGDNRASESFRVCNFLRRSVQSPRFFRLLSIERREIQADHVLLSLSPFFPLPFSSSLSLSLHPRVSNATTSRRRGLSRSLFTASFTASTLHATVCASWYKIYDRRYREICGRQGVARTRAARFQVEIAFWRLIDSWLLESDRVPLHGGRARKARRNSASRRALRVNQPTRGD